MKFGQANEISNKIRLAADAYIKANSTLIFTVIGAYGFSVLQNPHVVEANKDGSYLDLAQQNCVVTDEMHFNRVDGNVDMGIPGTYEVYYFAQDEQGNEIKSEKVTVKVVDNTAPTLRFADDTTGTITEKTIILDYGQAYTRPEMIVWNNSSIVNITLDDDESTYSGSNAEPGEYIMKYYAVDGSGKSSTVLTVKIIVNPKVQLPTIKYKDGRGSKTIAPNQVFTKDVILICEDGAEDYKVIYKASETSEPREIPYSKNMVLQDNGIYTITVIKNGVKNEVTFTIQIP